MNNFTFGNNDFGYYETIAGGAGAGGPQQALHRHQRQLPRRLSSPALNFLLNIFHEVGEAPL